MFQQLSRAQDFCGYRLLTSQHASIWSLTAAAPSDSVFVCCVQICLLTYLLTYLLTLTFEEVTLSMSSVSRGPSND